MCLSLKVTGREAPLLPSSLPRSAILAWEREAGRQPSIHCSCASCLKGLQAVYDGCDAYGKPKRASGQRRSVTPPLPGALLLTRRPWVVGQGQTHVWNYIQSPRRKFDPALGCNDHAPGPSQASCGENALLGTQRWWTLSRGTRRGGDRGPTWLPWFPPRLPPP